MFVMMKKMKKFYILFGILMLFSPSVLSQNTNLFIQDSLASVEFQKKGISAAKLGDNESAIYYLNQLYQLRKKMYGANSYRTASTLINLGILYKNIGELDVAIEKLKVAEKLYIDEFGGNYSRLGPLYGNMGNIYSTKGDYSKALEYLNYARIITLKDNQTQDENLKRIIYNISDAQFKLGLYDEVVRSSIENLNTTIPELKPRYYDLIANAYLKLKKYDLAEQNFLLAIKSWSEIYDEENIEYADQYLAYSSFLLDQQKFDKAFFYISKAKPLALRLHGEKSLIYSKVQSNFGDYYFLKNIDAHNRLEDFRRSRKSNLFQSIQYYQNAIVALVDSFAGSNPMIDPPLKNIISDIQIVEAFKKKASAMQVLGDIFLTEFDRENAGKYYVASINSLTKATELIHKLRIGFESEESKLFLAQDQESTFLNAIRLSYKMYKLTNDSKYAHLAFEFTERSKASSLLASIKDVQAKEFGGIPDSLLKKEEYIKKNIAGYTSSLYIENHKSEPDSQKVNLFNSKIFKLNQDYKQLVDHFEKTYPDYYSFKYENKTTGIKDVQSNLRSRDALVEFVVDEPRNGSNEGELYRFVITKNSVDFSKESIDGTYEQNIGFLFEFLTSTSYLFTKKRDFVHYSLASYGLYEKLLKPVAHLLQGKDLTIVPDDRLAYLPFDALLSQMPDTSRMNFRDLNYLVRDYTINHSYSSTLLFNFQDKNQGGTKKLIAFSPLYIAEEARNEGQSSRVFHFAPLPGAKQEVKLVSDLIRTVSFTDQQAQESTFKEKAVDFDILHLAMHTVINDSMPMFSKLVFSNPAEKSEDDGFLNTHEIYNLKLKARLAVLSACETGSGRLQKGEGVMSLARGFIYAGCPSIVMTLWQVEDKSGVEIMRNFYTYLSKGKRKDEALRMAKLKHLEISDPLTAHPHYWLGYVNIGNPASLYISKDFYFIAFLFIAAILVVVDWYYRKKKPRKSRG
jgi:CHAT domain-containing protein